MSQTISSLMERKVWVIDMDDTVAHVEGVFAANGLSWAPVVEAGQTLVGVISEADLLQFHAQGRDAGAVRAWQLCSYKPITVSADTPVTEVARQMVERKIHHVVVTQRGDIAGVVSSLDFVRTFVGESSEAP
jgi:predicted transcriptional regulator